MHIATALTYWVVVAVWLAVLVTAVIFFVRNPRVFGTTRLLLIVLALDTVRNLVENVYFGLYFGGMYGLFAGQLTAVLGRPFLLILPKLVNIAAGCLVLGLLLMRWLPTAISERRKAEMQVDHLQKLAAFDSLTGVFNRRHFLAVAETEWQRFQRYQRPLALLMIDIDRFKSINDRFGHDVGDRVIAGIARICRDANRNSDVVGRLGGEEFAMLLPETSLGDAGLVAERLRSAVASQRLLPPGDSAAPVTISIGVSEAQGAAAITELFKQADLALYAAKRTGRNKVSLAAELEEPARATELTDP
ncbi:MAG TPA: GGDEF domain-containing protein [Stellaceae bacterium]|nr:GGDEF domain-containing protein [Stellaceae bacterium]